MMALLPQASFLVFGLLWASLSMVVSCQPYVNHGGHVDRFIHEKIVDSPLPLQPLTTVGVVGLSNHPYGAAPVVYRSSEAETYPVAYRSSEQESYPVVCRSSELGAFEADQENALTANDARFYNGRSYHFADNANYRQGVASPAEIYQHMPYRYTIPQVVMVSSPMPYMQSTPATIAVPSLRSNEEFMNRKQFEYPQTARTLGVIRDILPGIIPGAADRDHLRPLQEIAAYNGVPGAYVPLSSYQHF